MFRFLKNHLQAEYKSRYDICYNAMIELDLVDVKRDIIQS
jgi:hypothetical protein